MSKLRQFLDQKRQKEIERLDQRIELNKVYEDNLDKSTFAKTYKIPSVPEQPQNTEKLLQNRVKQMEIARDNLKQILNPDVVVEVLQDIDKAGEINVFNRFFPGVKKLLEGQSKSTLTRNVFIDLWNKAKLEISLPDVKTQIKELKDLTSSGNTELKTLLSSVDKNMGDLKSSSNAEVKNLLSSIDKNMSDLKDLSKGELNNIILLLAAIRTDNVKIGDNTKDNIDRVVLQLRLIQQDQWKGIEANEVGRKENKEFANLFSEGLKYMNDTNKAQFEINNEAMEEHRKDSKFLLGHIAEASIGIRADLINLATTLNDIRLATQDKTVNLSQADKDAIANATLHITDEMDRISRLPKLTNEDKAVIDELKQELIELKNKSQSMLDANLTSSTAIRRQLASLGRTLDEIKTISQDKTVSLSEDDRDGISNATLHIANEMDRISRLPKLTNEDKAVIGELKQELIELKNTSQFQIGISEKNLEASTGIRADLLNLGAILNDIRTISRDKTVQSSEKDQKSIAGALQQFTRNLETLFKESSLTTTDREHIKRMGEESNRIARESLNIRTPPLQSPRTPQPEIQIDPSLYMNLSASHINKKMQEALDGEDEKAAEGIGQVIQSRLTDRRGVPGSILRSAPPGQTSIMLINVAKTKWPNINL